MKGACWACLVAGRPAWPWPAAGTAPHHVSSCCSTTGILPCTGISTLVFCFAPMLGLRLLHHQNPSASLPCTGSAHKPPSGPMLGPCPGQCQVGPAQPGVLPAGGDPGTCTGASAQAYHMAAQNSAGVQPPAQYLNVTGITASAAAGRIASMFTVTLTGAMAASVNSSSCCTSACCTRQHASRVEGIWRQSLPALMVHNHTQWRYTDRKL